MSWLINFRKYKKNVKNLLFARSELEYQEIILEDAHHDFEIAYLQYCAENNIDVQKLNNDNQQKVDEIFTETSAKKNELIHKPVEKAQEKTKVFNAVYRDIAKKLHPDKLSVFLPAEEIKEKEDMFKKAAGAMKNCDWGKLLDVADKLNIKPKTFDGMEEQIESEIKKINKIIEHNNNTYSWLWVNCETDECREKVILNFLNQLFGYTPS